MGHASFTFFRQNLASFLDEVTGSREPLVVTRQGGKGNVVVISEDEFAGWQETVYLLSSPRNAERLMQSVREIRDRQTTERALQPSSMENPARA